jgi:uncharacterized protein
MPMRTKLFIIALFAIVLSLSLRAQNVVEPYELKPHVDVTGTAEMEITPDEIYISITIKERYEGRDKLSIEVQEEKLKSSLKEIGINLTNLTLADANAGYVKVKVAKKDVLTKKDYLLKVADAAQVGKAFEQLEKLQITGAYIARVDHSKMDEFRKENRVKAIKAAREKAEYLLAAIGQAPGKAVIVEDVTDKHVYNTNALNESYGNTSYFSVSSKNEPEELTFNKLNIRSSIYVRFEIKQ